MPLQARRCHVALSGFCGPCGQVSEEAAGTRCDGCGPCGQVSEGSRGRRRDDCIHDPRDYGSEKVVRVAILGAGG